MCRNESLSERIEPWMVLLSVLFFQPLSFGQNLVPNPSFEEVKELKCSLNVPLIPPFENPKTWFQSILKDWILPTEVPAQVYSTLLSKDCQANPKHLFDKGSPKDGFNMVEIETLALYLYGYNGRTYVETKLKDPLVAGKYYRAGGYYSLASNYGSYSSNNLGMLFTIEKVGHDTTLMLNYNPQINESDVNANPSVWKHFGGCLAAEGNEQYLTIGNFFDDQHTRVKQVLEGDTRGSDFASYFIDSVYVEKINEIIIPNVITPNADASNETFVLKGLVSGEWSVSIFNRWDLKVFHDNNYNNGWNGGGLSDGVYYYYVQSNICPDLHYSGPISIIH